VSLVNLDKNLDRSSVINLIDLVDLQFDLVIKNYLDFDDLTD